PVSGDLLRRKPPRLPRAETRFETRSMEMNSSRSATARAFWLTVVVFVGGAMCAASAQTRPQPQMKTQTSGSTPEPVASPSILVNAEEDYRIGPRDVIEVKIADADELSQNYEVRADGTFLMTYLNRVKAGGKTPDELARFIEDGLRGNYLKNPHVSVVVRQFNSHT